MAKRNFLVDGLSGVGKSSVYEELIRRGFERSALTVPGVITEIRRLGIEVGG